MGSVAVGTKRVFASLGDDNGDGNDFFRQDDNSLGSQETATFRARESHQRRKPDTSGTSERELTV